MMKVIKIIAFSIIIILVGFYITLKVLERREANNFLRSIVGTNNSQYAKYEDYDWGGFGPAISYSVYVYKIQDINKISCQLFDSNKDSNAYLDEFDKTYIDINKKFCEKLIEYKTDTHVVIMIQNDILIIKRFYLGNEN